ncbi:dTMP kinase [Paenibacillus sp. J2TS4]|uniref:dTMP kinase n=1 Tax=Paenibacillus sp. J2TS4 TaxID=2807194 RepID=UPI001B04996B|nr:dTMP kinase [Paenibacillus sp. J2TS4]GIP36309.1 thymidylate kinase [Paenibacillus sp. J2TS4]
MEGIFVTFEGPDGSGKTTQLKMLAERLHSKGYDVVVTREPGGTPISDEVRRILLSPDNEEMIDQTEVLLYAAARAQHVHEKIIPALEQKRIVLCDRYIDASVAYQAYGLGLDLQTVLAISQFASGGLQPVRTYMLDVPVEVSRQRLLDRSSGGSGPMLDRIELKGNEYHARVRKGFLAVAESNRERIRLIQADRPLQEIADEIAEDFEKLIHPDSKVRV